MGLLSVWMVSMAADGVGGLVGRAISFQPLIYIGRISYGIYVYHYFVPTVLEPLFERFQIAHGSLVFVAICFVVTMIVSSLSWFLMEKPINSLKDKFAGSSAPLSAGRGLERSEVGLEAES
jgi:peptidoglycan/LPS O-acetylase OafA/YrhL